VERLRRDWERLVTFNQLSKGHWHDLRKHDLRTNVVESPFASVQLRTMAGKQLKRVD
jgi:hypothetical protein